jgi:hypothetical protein
VALFTTALALYGGALWSCELQGFIVHEMMPSFGSWHAACGFCARDLSQLAACLKSEVARCSPVCSAAVRVRAASGGAAVL